MGGKRVTGGSYDFVDNDKEQMDALKKSLGKHVKMGAIHQQPEELTSTPGEEAIFSSELNFLKKHWVLIAIVAIAVILGVMDGTGFFTIPWYIIFVLYLMYVMMIKNK